MKRTLFALFMLSSVLLTAQEKSGAELFFEKPEKTMWKIF